MSAKSEVADFYTIDKKDELDNLILDLWEAMMFSDLSESRCITIEIKFKELVKARWHAS